MAAAGHRQRAAAGACRQQPPRHRLHGSRAARRRRGAAAAVVLGGPVRAGDAGSLRRHPGADAGTAAGRRAGRCRVPRPARGDGGGARTGWRWCSPGGGACRGGRIDGSGCKSGFPRQRQWYDGGRERCTSGIPHLSARRHGGDRPTDICGAQGRSPRDPRRSPTGQGAGTEPVPRSAGLPVHGRRAWPAVVCRIGRPRWTIRVCDFAGDGISAGGHVGNGTERRQLRRDRAGGARGGGGGPGAAGGGRSRVCRSTARA